jgi:hypothetical protein
MSYNFTEETRRVLAMAREEAIRVHHDYVGTEHMLLALLREEEGAGMAILRGLGVRPERVRNEIMGAIRIGRATITSEELPYTARAANVLNFAKEVVDELHLDYIGTDHLLIALIREEKGIASEVLVELGVTAKIARQESLRMRPTPVSPASGADARTDVPGEAAAAGTAPPTQAQAGSNATPAIFISYRRGDEAGYVAGRIYDKLVAEFGPDAVFKDFDSIPLGVDFKLYLERAVEKCAIFLAVISPGWQERLQNPRDFVRIELEVALRRDIPVIPLFVLRAAMPAEEQLPPALHPLIYRNGTEIRPDPDFTNDMNRLITALRRFIGAQ